MTGASAGARVSTGGEGAGGGADVPTGATAPTAAAALSSPPVTDSPASSGAGLTRARRSVLSWAAVSDGSCASISASAPLTIGVAIEVPLA